MGQRYRHRHTHKVMSSFSGRIALKGQFLPRPWYDREEKDVISFQKQYIFPKIKPNIDMTKGK